MYKNNCKPYLVYDPYIEGRIQIFRDNSPVALPQDFPTILLDLIFYNP